MKTIIAGGRDYLLQDDDVSKLDSIKDQITQVVSGAAKGVDACGELWARQNNIPIKMFPADWKSYGKKAGYLRNKQMAEYADACVLFCGGKGTQMMFDLATEYGLKIYDFRLKS
jgi:hypothetical protein